LLLCIYFTKEKMAHIARTPPPALTLRTERSVEINVTRYAAAQDRAALTELNSIDLGYAKRAGGHGSKQWEICKKAEDQEHYL
jgi:hypothetical protein